MELEEMERNKFGLSLYTFRGNVSKINKKIKKVIEKEAVLEAFKISIEGQRGAKFYGLKANKNKLKIIY